MRTLTFGFETNIFDTSLLPQLPALLRISLDLTDNNYYTDNILLSSGNMASLIRKRIKLPGYKLGKEKRPTKKVKTQAILEEELRLRRLVSFCFSYAFLNWNVKLIGGCEDQWEWPKWGTARWSLFDAISKQCPDNYIYTISTVLLSLVYADILQYYNPYFYGAARELSYFFLSCHS